MPRRGGGGGGGGRVRNWKDGNDHFEHDDRVPTNSTRRVSFKPGTNKGKNKFRNLNNAAKALLDEDIDMGATAAQMHNRKVSFRGGRGRLNSPVPRSHLLKRKFISGMLPWYQIIIPYGAKHEKDVILRALLGFLSPDIFIPHYYKVSGNAAIFYVDDVKIAEKLFNADRKITMPDGYKMVIIVKNYVPNVTIDADLKEKMKLAMAKRYNATIKALDLTKFHADPDLADIFCALFRPQVLLAAIDIIAENIPNLEALNLNDNKIHNIDHLRILPTKLKSLKILYIGDNRIPHQNQMDVLKGLPLVELLVKGNPFITRMKDHDVYVSEMRKKFPKLTRLDGVDLPPAIGFDVADDATLPPKHQTFLVDPTGQNLVREFLTQYFALYDSESRQPLLDAYHEHASMSMACNYLTNDNRNSQITKLNAYITNSRNLIRIIDRDSRRRYLRNGRLQVVSFLSDLPKSKHDLMGFAFDLLVFTPTVAVLTMNGVYTETHTSGNPTRSFHRTFVIVPNSNGGFCIVNDMLFVTNTTKEQEDKLASSTSSAAAPTPAPAAMPLPPPAASPAAVVPVSDSDKQVMLNMLGQQTGMNDHWSINCLQETGWDFQRALFIFNQLHSEGKIPADAFIK